MDRPSAMARLRPTLLAATALLAAGIAAAACSGGDDDDGGGSPSPTVTFAPDPTPLPGSLPEEEPNDDPADATPVTGTGAILAFHGRCAVTGDTDWFAFTLSTGSVTVTVTWDERTYVPAPHLPNDLDVYVEDSSGVLASDDALPPGDSPAEVTAGVVSAGAVRVLVDCFQADADLFYQGTLVP